jgi:predicted dehydrogenase
MDQLQPQVSRRDMLRKAGAAGVAAFTIVNSGAVRGADANSAISVGLIGAGNRGDYDASIVQADPRARITAVCDLFDDRIESGIPKIKAEKPDVYKDFEKLLASNIDAVIIATPPFEHPRMLAAAVQAGKHVYCEKPAGVDLEGCKKVMAIGRAANPKKLLWFGFQQRYGPLYQEAYKRLSDGAIGELATARGFWIDANPFTRVAYSDPKVEKLRNWFAYRDLSGDFIIEQDCHNLDMFHWFLGALPLRAVGYAGKKIRKDFETYDHLSLSFEFPDGIHVNFEANQLSPKGFKRVGEEFSGTTGVLATSRAALVHTKGPGQVETVRAKRDQTVDAFEQFLTHIQSGEPVNMAEQAARSTMVGILGRTALYRGHEATWKGEFGTT